MTRARQQPIGSLAAQEGRLLARPAAPATPGPTGLQKLGLGGNRDGFLYVPPGYRADQPAPLALLLHGAGGTAEHGLWLLQSLADAMGMILLSPDSRQRTWDIIVNRYGPDIAFIDQALALTFDRYVVDPTHLAVGGFSDGASYALSVGLTNGDLFTHILAFSPGFLKPGDPRGRPDIYISHGTHDAVLPIDRCSRRIVPQLERAGYAVRYREFDGPHTVPPEIAREAADWFLAPSL
jgi:phospholipase/carboxylesterase